MGDVDTTPEGLYYMPRALWSAGYPDSNGLDQLRVPFNRSHFRNGSRWPVQITRLALSAINYPIATTTDVATLGTNIVSNTVAGALYGARIQMAVPFRKRFSRMDLHLGSLTPKPTQPPGPRTVGRSDIYGLSYLEFDRPLYIPKQGSAEFSLSSLSAMRYTGDINFEMPTADINARAFWHESGGFFNGASRQKELTIRTDDTGEPSEVNPPEGFPYPRPSNWTGLAVPGTQRVPFWDSLSHFGGSQFSVQNATQSGSTALYGLGAMIDQIDYDDTAEANIVAAGGAANSTTIAPLSTRVGCRARVSNGLATDWWWRPGAPLALVLDTVTPAIVYELPEPITLNPSQAMSVEMSIPITAFADGIAVGGDFPNRYQFGISFNGYSVIEG